MIRRWLARRRARRMNWTLRSLNFVRHRPCGKFLIPDPNDPDIQHLIRTKLVTFNAAICLCARGPFVLSE